MKEIACKLLVIGAGPGGYVCAIRAGQLGIDTVIVESGKAVEHALPANQRDRIGVVLISLDPAKDTPAALRAMAKMRTVPASRSTHS